MQLNPQTIRRSFDAVKPQAGEVLEHFYHDLFRRHPEAKPLFEGVDMAAQINSLAGSLVFLVDNLEDGEKISSYLYKMGERHFIYGVKEEHLAWVGESLIATLAHFFGAEWTSELEQQWGLVYGVIAGEFKKGLKAGGLGAQESSASEIERLVRDHVQIVIRDVLAEELSTIPETVRGKVKAAIREAIEAEVKQAFRQKTQHAS